MLTEPTLEKLKALRLDALAAAWLAQQQDPALAAVPFDERLGLLVEAEWLARENRRLATALREAKLRLSQACVEDIDYAARRELDKAILRQLATCRWVHYPESRIIPSTVCVLAPACAEERGLLRITRAGSSVRDRASNPAWQRVPDAPPRAAGGVDRGWRGSGARMGFVGV